ncbi:Ribonuclease Zc3h12a-like, NYN domain [Cinara cedri]|uniref:Ribonuclease Zc3h12a-like, NYN domain n=1 Tax=Cinara cedri TaxID=506608 RepID=A0A5E4NKG7_9HEMI|nr:Ribonuclease Zc3h12a-like, NYN domain [Cinara cedri]
MGKVGKKKNLKTVSFLKKNNSSRKQKKRRSKTFNRKNSVKKRVVMKAIKNSHNKKYKKKPIPNTNLNIDTEVIEIEDNSICVDTSSEISVIPNNNNTTIIDITDISDEVYDCHRIPSKIKTQNIKCDDVIDITDTTINENSQSIIECISSDDNDTETLECLKPTSVENKHIHLITISDDSDEEKIEQQPTIIKPTQFVSIKKSLESATDPINKLKKKYISPLPLRNRKKTKINEDLNFNFGAFIIDKQRIPDQLQNYIQIEKKRQPSLKKINLANRKLRPIAIDGLNIGYKHGGGGTFSPKGIELCVEFFTKRGHKDILAFLPEHRQGPPGSDMHTIINKLDKKGHICFTPSRKVQNKRMTCYDDRIILDYANKCGAVVISNDYYRDLYDENEEFKHIIENRQVMITFARDEILVPEDQYNHYNRQNGMNDIRCLSDILSFPA